MHGYEQLSNDPSIIYPGNLQGRSVRECGPKGAVVVRVEDGEVVAVTRLILERIRWESLSTDLTAAALKQKALEPSVHASARQWMRWAKRRSSSRSFHRFCLSELGLQVQPSVLDNPPRRSPVGNSCHFGDGTKWPARRPDRIGAGGSGASQAHATFPAQPTAPACRLSVPHIRTEVGHIIRKTTALACITRAGRPTRYDSRSCIFPGQRSRIRLSFSRTVPGLRISPFMLRQIQGSVEMTGEAG